MNRKEIILFHSHVIVFEASLLLPSTFTFSHLNIFIRRSLDYSRFLFLMKIDGHDYTCMYVGAVLLSLAEKK